MFGTLTSAATAFGAALRRRGVRITLAATAIAVMAGGIAYSAIPGADGQIHGCYDRRGALRVVDTGAGGACLPTETPLTWNQQGVPGPQGPQGGLSGWEVVRVVSEWTPGFQKAVAAVCPSGKRPMGGGYFPKDYQGALEVLGSYPSEANGGSGGVPPSAADFQGWALYARNTDLQNTASAIVYAVCASVS